MAIEFAKKSEMRRDDAAAEAVIENAKLPRMSDKPARVSRAQAAKVMDPNPKPDKGGKDRMAVVRKAGAAKKGKASAQPFPDQVEAKGAAGKVAARRAKAAGAGGGDSYLRIRVRVENGEMSVVDVREVEGPLVQPETLSSGFAYEVTLGDKRVALGSVPDLGEWRSYPSPSGPPELRVHHVTKVSEAEFNVRVPREEISLSALPKTDIILYEVKQPTEDKLSAVGPTLEAEFTNEIREVARLSGIKVEALPKEAQKKIRQALK